jgi:hypothetical protein
MYDAYDQCDKYDVSAASRAVALSFGEHNNNPFILLEKNQLVEQKMQDGRAKVKKNARWSSKNL